MLLEQNREGCLLLIAISTRTRTVSLYLEVQQDPREVTPVVQVEVCDTHLVLHTYSIVSSRYLEHARHVALNHLTTEVSKSAQPDGE